MMLGLLLAVTLSGGSIVKGLIVLFLGLLLAMVGLDPISGKVRFTFGSIGLQGGFDFVTLAMGVFGISEILYNLESTVKTEIVTTRIGKVFPTLKDWADSRWSILRGSVVGFFIGIIPGGGAVISSLASYAIEKKCARHREEFGRGAIEGVAGPESANNAASSSSFIPLLTLGIPGNASIAMIFAALMIQGITPGPFLIKEHPDVFWGVIASMYLGNAMLLVLNLPLVGLWVQMLRVPYSILAPIIVLFTTVGVYSVQNQSFDIYSMLFFAALGYLMRKLKFDPAPLPLAFVLGPMVESSLRQSLLMSGGDPMIFLSRPISGTLLAILFVLVLGQVSLYVKWNLQKRRGRAGTAPFASGKRMV
jgi:putative tricarboxylic transport membrane protein